MGCQWRGVLQWWVPIIVSPIVGSFLGVLVRRLPAGRPVAWARSACETCGHALSPRELLPVASFLWQRGRCRHCGGRIAPAHLAIELAAVAVALSAVTFDRDAADLWADCVLGWVLLALAWIDWTDLRLPDGLTLPLVLAGLAATVLLDPAAITDHAVAAALGYAALRLLALAYRAWRGRDGLGAGDAKLLAAAGAWVGVAGLGPTVLLAALAGFGVAVIRGGGLRATTVIPFGTCLALGCWIVRLAG